MADEATELVERRVALGARTRMSQGQKLWLSFCVAAKVGLWSLGGALLVLGGYQTLSGDIERGSDASYLALIAILPSILAFAVHFLYRWGLWVADIPHRKPLLNSALPDAVGLSVVLVACFSLWSARSGWSAEREDRVEVVRRIDQPVYTEQRRVLDDGPRGARATESPAVAPSTAPASSPTTGAPATAWAHPPAEERTDLARLRVVVKPWGEVYIDGSKKGLTPMRPLMLPPGTYQLRLVNPDLGRDETQTLTLEPRGDVLVKKDWR